MQARPSLISFASVTSCDSGFLSTLYSICAVPVIYYQPQSHLICNPLLLKSRTSLISGFMWIVQVHVLAVPCCTYFACLNSEIVEIELPSIAFNFSAHISANVSCKKKKLEHMRRHSDPFSIFQPWTIDCRAIPPYPGPNERPNHALQSQRPRSPALESIANGPFQREQRCGSQALGNVRDSTSKDLYHMI